MTFYICDLQAHCCQDLGCIRNGGACRHTGDPTHAINGECLTPHMHPERFEPESFKINDSAEGIVTYYWEIEATESDQTIL